MDRPLVYFMLSVLLMYILQGSIWYTMPLLFSQTFSNNLFNVGLLISLIPLIEVLVAIPFGFYADFGRIKSIFFVSSLSLLMVPMLILMNSQIFNAIGVFMLAIGGIGIWIAAIAYLSSMINKKDVRYVGYEFSVMSLGWVFGPILGGFTYQLGGGFGLTLMETFVIAISSFLMLVTMSMEIKMRRKHAPKLLQLLRSESKIIKKIPDFLLLFFFLGFIFDFYSYAVWVSVPLLTVLRGMSLIVGGIIVGIVEVPYVIGDAVGGYIYKRNSEWFVITACLIIAIVSILAAAWFENISFFGISILFITGLALSIASITTWNLIISKDRADVGEISAMSVIAGGLGGALGALVAGASLVHYQFTVSAIVVSVLSFLLLIYLNVVFKRVKL